MRNRARFISLTLFLAAAVGLGYSVYSPLEQWLFSRNAIEVVAKVTDVEHWSEDVATVPGVWDMDAIYQDVTVVFTAPTGDKVRRTLHRVQGMNIGKELILLVGGDGKGEMRPWIRWVSIAVETILFIKLSLMLFCFGAAAASTEA